MIPIYKTTRGKQNDFFVGVSKPSNKTPKRQARKFLSRALTRRPRIEGETEAIAIGPLRGRKGLKNFMIMKFNFT